MSGMLMSSESWHEKLRQTAAEYMGEAQVVQATSPSVSRVWSRP